LEVIEQGYGADALRLYVLFAAPIELDVLWDAQGVPGAYRFLSRIWTLAYEFLESETEENNVISTELLRLTHKTIKTVTERIENGNFNTAISAMMELTNDLYKIKAEKGIYQSGGWRTALESLTQLVAPFAPHLAEELWQGIGNTTSVHISPWPKWDESLVAEDMVTLAVQINGKVRSEITVVADISETDAIETAKQDEKIAAQIEGKTVQKAIYVPGRLVSLVI
jgi:leucyl-tRNA synthetase